MQLKSESVEKKNYTATIEVAKSPNDVFNHVNDVSKWWNKEFEGSSTKLNDEFIIRHGDVHYSKHKLVEFTPDKKVVWLVTDSKLIWLEKDMYEWTGTKMIFELAPQGDKTVLNFTHQGLVPEKECYERCAQGWDFVIKERLFSFITDGKAI